MLIVFEGYDNTGKSSIIEKISRSLNNRNISFLNTLEPYNDSILSRKLNDTLRENISTYDQKLFTLLHKLHIEDSIIPALKEGKVVLCDRYIYSAYAYNTDTYDMKDVYRDEIINPDIIIHLKSDFNNIFKRGIDKLIPYPLGISAIDLNDEDKEVIYNHHYNLVTQKYKRIFSEKNNVVEINTDDIERFAHPLYIDYPQIEKIIDKILDEKGFM